MDNVIVAGLSYGQGSSREHAALCPMYLGVRMVAAKSIERIHRSNLINFGIVPATFAREEDYDRLHPGDRVEVPDLRARIAAGKGLELRGSGEEHDHRTSAANWAPREREIILAGGMLNFVKAKKPCKTKCIISQVRSDLRNAALRRRVRNGEVSKTDGPVFSSV